MPRTPNPVAGRRAAHFGRPATQVWSTRKSHLTKAVATDRCSNMNPFGRTTQMASNIVLAGEHDACTVADLSATLAKSISTGNDDLVVDLSQVQFMAAATVGVLLRARMLLGIRSRSLRLRSPSQRARRILELSDLADLIDPADLR
jgi:anti-anti-sigma factor